MTAPVAAPVERVYPVRDETLLHQIVLTQAGVSCNCRRILPGVSGGAPGYAVFAPLRDADACLAAYRDPAHHVGEFRP